MRNRRSPDEPLEGEILPASAPDSFSLESRPQRIPSLPTHDDFAGIFNVVPRLRAWGQAKGYKALATTLAECERALIAKKGVMRAVEDLARQEARISQLGTIQATARLEVDSQFDEARERLLEVRSRIRRDGIRSEIDEEDLRRRLIIAQRATEAEEGKGRQSPVVREPEPSLESQVEDLARQLLEIERKISRGTEAGTMSEAGLHAEELKISMILHKMEALRSKAGV